MTKQGASIFFAEMGKDRCSGLEREVSEYGVLSKGFLTDVPNPADMSQGSVACNSYVGSDAARVGGAKARNALRNLFGKFLSVLLVLVAVSMPTHRVGAE